MSDCFIGEIRMFAGTYAPDNWALCNGASMNLQQNQILYSLIGTTYGGDGQTTFNLPDLRGRIPVGQGNGTALTPRVNGQSGGTETVTLTTAEMAAHTHALYTANVAPTSQTVGPTMLYAQMVPNPTIGTNGLYTTALPPVTTVATADTKTITSSGGGQPHANIMATTCITFIIATLGMYPTRN
jgi:microcystin-dependent protein